MEKKNRDRKIATVEITSTALMTAIICILAPIAIHIPVSPVPITLATFAIYFMTYILGMKMSVIAVIVYLLLGAAGLPVFGSYSGGIARLFAAAGGYMWGYIPMAAVEGYFVDHLPEKRAVQIGGMILATLACYLPGTMWLSAQLHMNFIAGLGVGVIPYIPGDTVKIIITILVAPEVKRRLMKSGVLPQAVRAKVNAPDGDGAGESQN